MKSTTESNTQCVSSDGQRVPVSKTFAFNRWFRPRPTFVVIAVILTLALAGSFRFSRNGTSLQAIAETSIDGLDQNTSTRLTGTTEAVHSRAITTPLLSGEHLGRLTLTQVISSGSHVKKGDIVAEFDRQAQMQEFVNKQSEYEKLADQLTEEQAKEGTARAKDETEIREAESAVSKAELEMRKLELFSRIDAEKAQEDLEEAQATLKQLRETFGLKRKAAQAGIQILEIQRDRAKQIMEHAHADSDLLQIHSPLDGIVVLNMIFHENGMHEVQEGDQLDPGVTFLQVIDPSSMQVRASVNQEDFLSLRVGQPGKVHLDAYPDIAFSGRVESIAPIARSGISTKLRTFDVVFSIDGNDARLMPDLSAAIDLDRARGMKMERDWNK